MKERISTIIIATVVGIFAGSLPAFVFSAQQKSEEGLIKEFYAVENAVHVSPHSLRKAMAKGDTDSYVLIDLRSAEEYETEHITTAINIPAYADPETSAYGDKERIIGSFREIVKNNPGKEVVVYCYSMPCMTGRKVGKMLADEGIFVKHLGIGWNEWRYFWNLWNHDGETPSIVFDYVISGTEPGMPKVSELPTPCGGEEFGC